jgi:hypothetical protein
VPIRLLITARDMAAALHLVEVARVAAADPRFEVVVAAQPPALHRFEAGGRRVKVIEAPIATTAGSVEADQLRRTARALLADVRPDAVLVGLSTPFDAGIDEAVLAEAQVPSSLMQDFWGEQNLILGRGADYILAIDEQAAERNLARFGKPSIVVGSARHSAYAALDIGACRARVRATAGFAASDLVVGFFGQALHAMPGYQRTLSRFIECVGAIEDVRLVLRPHPREDATQRRQTEQMFFNAGLAATDVGAGPVEEALAACDVVVSLFSICTFDAAYLNRFAPAPVAVPMSLLFDEEIAAYCRQHGNYFDFAHHTLGLVMPVYSAADLPAKLQLALQPESKRNAWKRAHRHLPDPAAAPRLVLEHILTTARQQDS